MEIGEACACRSGLPITEQTDFFPSSTRLSYVALSDSSGSGMDSVFRRDPPVPAPAMRSSTKPMSRSVLRARSEAAEISRDPSRAIDSRWCFKRTAAPAELR